MVLFWIILILALSGSNAEGQFRILHSPDSLKFKPIGTTWESTLKEIFAAALGLTVEFDSEWDGLQIMNPFNTPEAAVDVHIDGVSGLEENFGLKSAIFPLLVDAYEPDTFKGVKLKIQQRFDVGGNELVNFDLSDVTKFNRIKTAFGKVDAASYKTDLLPKLIHLNQEVMEDRLFLKELRTLRAVIEKIKDGVLSADKIIDFYNFRFRTLHTLSDYYGPFSSKTKEAKQLLGVALQDLSKAFVKAYSGSVLVIVVTTEVSHSRRSARAATRKPLGHSNKWTWPQLNQDKKSNEAQTGGRQESDVERVDGNEHLGYSPAYTKSSTKSPGKRSPKSPEFVTHDALRVYPEAPEPYETRRTPEPYKTPWTPWTPWTPEPYKTPWAPEPYRIPESYRTPEDPAAPEATEAPEAPEATEAPEAPASPETAAIAEAPSSSENTPTKLSDDEQAVVSVDSEEPEPQLPQDNAAIFNLFLHLGLAWFFAMLSIVYFIMDMDPGRDTVIYRMTSVKSTKKDV